ncbi:acyl-CoA reductase [Streptomyces mirabilis]|uniref:acyl-CoA reductase n=1 Tax=Streptomyces mirabilis TaxID=68239 RepID=UPI00167EEEAF|nr:acyl-CoA reductase [Streptomyces mirabilis]
MSPASRHPPDGTCVVPVDSLLDAAAHATVAAQTVGVYPAHRKAELRDRLARAGVQRVVKLGSALSGSIGNPHDAMYPLHRFVNWVVDDDA